MAPIKPEKILSKVNTPLFYGGMLTFFLFYIYLLRCSRDYYWVDSAEFAYIAPIWGLAHPTGYPLYSIIIGLISFIPLPLPLVLSALSAIFATLAILVLFRIMLLCKLDPITAMLLGFFIGLSQVVIDLATVAEVYTLHLLFQMLIVYFIIKWQKEYVDKDLLLAFFLLGLSFSNHASTVWLLLPFLMLLFSHRQKFNFKTCYKYFAAFIAGLLPYLYLLIRANTDPIYNQNDPSNLASLLNVVTGSIFRYRMFGLSEKEILDQIQLWFDSITNQWYFAALLFVPLGMVYLYKRFEKVLFLAMISWLAISLLICWNYFIPDKQGYYLIPHLLTGLLAGFGIIWSVDFLAANYLQTNKNLIGKITIALLLAALVYPNLSFSRSNNTSLRDYTIDCLKYLDQSTLLVTDDISLHYSILLLQRDKVLPADIKVVSMFLIGFKWYHEFLRKNYPSLKIPEDFDKLSEKFRQIDPNNSRGSKSQRHVELMTRQLISANLKISPVAVYLREKKEELTQYLGFKLKSRGLAYKIIPDKESAAPQYKCDFNAKYLVGKDKLKDRYEIQVASHLATTCNRLGIYQVEQKRFLDALDSFRKALRYDPEYLQAMKNIGVVYLYNLNNPQEAAKNFRKYVNMAGDKADESVVNWLDKTGK